MSVLQRRNVITLNLKAGKAARSAKSEPSSLPLLTRVID
jgi:hypothetical protein